jgi:alpha-methylacyl-CoA racemase
VNDFLNGVTVVEMSAIGPVPFCGMTLADLGAEVIRIDRPVPADLGLPMPSVHDFQARGKKSVVLDLKHPLGRAAANNLIAHSDIVLEGFRPGVMERLGLGPQPLMATNPALVYGRVSGWGATGERALQAGHDINFLAASGVLGAIGTRSRPLPPLNLVGDYGAALNLVAGVLAACLRARATGQGAVVETSILRGAANMMTLPYSLRAAGQWSEQRDDNILDGAAPFYRAYETQDGRHMAVGAIEPPFYRQFLKLLGAGDELDPAAQLERASWPATIDVIARLFRANTQRYWTGVFDLSDACCTPVLSLDEAANDPHNRAQGVFSGVGKAAMPEAGIAGRPSSAAALPEAGAHTAEVLLAAGYTREDVDALLHDGAAHSQQASS